MASSAAAPTVPEVSSMPPLPLNALITRSCNADCRFCVEKTRDDTKGRLDGGRVVAVVNDAIRRGLVGDVLLLGGEPLYHPDIEAMVRGLLRPPIITSNGTRLVRDRAFRERFARLPVKALNISLPHYDAVRRREVMGRHLFDNGELSEALSGLPFPVRVNCLLMKGYVDSLDEIEKMAAFCAGLGVRELKMGELTARDPGIHDFVAPEVVAFNRAHYVAVPVPDIARHLHRVGGTVAWRKFSGVDVLFNAAPNVAQRGGLDEDGNHYHYVLFNDGRIGFSWRRADGLADAIEPGIY
jgi:MoaA/NifB/PqqE/SkfB family radical SAM enzyme